MKIKEVLKKKKANLIICHIGSGASISCIKDGKCFDTTMGITPLDGLMMGTRSGSIDPSILEYVCPNTDFKHFFIVFSALKTHIIILTFFI